MGKQVKEKYDWKEFFVLFGIVYGNNSVTHNTVYELKIT